MHLPPHVYELFTAPPPLEVIPEKPRFKEDWEILPLAPEVEKFDEKVSLVGLAPPGPTGIVVEWQEQIKLREQRAQRKIEQAIERGKAREAHIAKHLSAYDPNKSNEKKTKNAFNTMFIGNLKASTSESSIREFLKEYGKILMVSHYPKQGFAFVEFENDDDLKEACKRCIGRRLDGRRIVVDVERARTVPDWKPKWLGGGQRSASRPDYRSGGNKRSRYDREGDRDWNRDRDRGRDWDRNRSRDNYRDRDYDRGDRRYNGKRRR